MAIFDYIKNKLKNNKEQELVDKWTKTLEENKKLGKENPIDDTNAELLDEIEQSANPDRLAQEIIKRGFEDDNIPNRLVENFSIKVAASSEVSDSAITNAITRSDANISDNAIGNIIKKGSLNEDEKDRLIRSIDDEKIVEEIIRNDLYILYRNCKDKTDNEVVDELDRKISQLHKKTESDIDIQDLVEKVISKKMAENYYSEVKQRTRIFTFSKLMPVEEMFAEDFASKVEDEYKKIENERGNKEGRFNKEFLKSQILIQVGKNIGYKHRKTGEFIVPQSAQMRNITEEEEQDFIRAIQSASLKEMSEDEIISIKESIRGVVKNEQTREKIILEQIKSIENRDNISADDIMNIFSDRQKIKTLIMLERGGLIDELNRIPPDAREKAILMIKDTYSSRREKREIEKRNSNKVDKDIDK